MVRRQSLLVEVIGGDPVDVTIGGAAVPASAVASVVITRGRTQVDQRTAPATLSATFDTAQLPRLPVVGDQVVVDLSAAAVAYFGTTPAAHRRFVGKVTDAAAVSTKAGQPDRVQLAAAGTRARLAQLDIADAPWPQELDGARAARILTLAHVADPSLVTTADAGAVSVLGVDVDKRKAGDLLDELAVTSGGELAELRDGTLAWHDANHRRNIASSVELTPADVLAPVTWQQQLGGLLNDVTLGYGTDGGSGQATVRVVDDEAAATWPAQQTLATQLVDVAAATSRGNELVGRFGRPRWRLPALAVELLRGTTTAKAAAVLALDFGQLLSLTGFPDAGPFVVSRLFVEGATETITRNGWTVALAVSDYRATGPATRWADVPTTATWATVDPADLSWLAAVAWYSGGDPSQGRWLDQPADLTWQAEPAALTWATA